jgi:hypothetical protein
MSTWSYKELAEPVKQESDVRQGDSLGPYLCSICTNDIIACGSEEKAYVPAVDMQIISPLLSANNLVTGSFPLTSLLNGDG